MSKDPRSYFVELHIPAIDIATARDPETPKHISRKTMDSWHRKLEASEAAHERLMDRYFAPALQALLNPAKPHEFGKGDVRVILRIEPL